VCVCYNAIHISVSVLAGAGGLTALSDDDYKNILSAITVGRGNLLLHVRVMCFVNPDGSVAASV